MRHVFKSILFVVGLVLAGNQVEAATSGINLSVINSSADTADVSIRVRTTGTSSGERRYAFRLAAASRRLIVAKTPRSAMCRLHVAVHTKSGSSTLRDISCATRRLVFDGHIAFVGSRPVRKATRFRHVIHEHAQYGAAPPPSLGPEAGEKDPRAVDLLYATNRVRVDKPEAAYPSYGFGRSNSLQLGAARVRIPEAHVFGHMELARAAIQIGGFTLIRARNDPKKNFVIQALAPLDKEAWMRSLAGAQGDEALVFVHGFNVSFEKALMRAAQLAWDIEYKGPVVLFSWPSRGGIRGYGYDKDSAFGARQRFVELLSLLQGEGGVKKVNVIAHSMGNLVVVDALANYARTENPRPISELILAAPDLDQDLFADDIAALSKIVGGITMYASSADKALKVAQQLANDRRAGQIFKGQPFTVAGMDSIDATKAGNDLFGLNHSIAMTTTSLLKDIKSLLASKLRPPSERSPGIVGFPEGAAAKYWRVVQ